MPTDRKLRVIELGSGRGAFTRYLALKLLEMDKLDEIVATNISDNENVFNQQQAKKAGIPFENYRVVNENFDDLSVFKDSSFDLVISQDALYHSHDHGKIGREMGRLLRKGGITVFNDIVVQQNISAQEMPMILETFHLNGLASADLYDKNLIKGGLTKKMMTIDGGQAIWRHFGA